MIIEHPYQIPKFENREDLRLLPFKSNGVLYNYCFIILNPFYKRKSPFENFDIQKPNWIEGSKSEIIEHYEIFTWTDFMKYSGIKDIKEISHCLYVKGHNYYDNYQKVKKQIWENFQETLSGKHLIPNPDSHLSILLIDRVLLSLEKLGYSKVRLYDLYNEHEQTGFYELSDLIQSVKEFPMEFRLVTDDQQLLFYQEYERYNTFLFSNDIKKLNSFIEIADLEGFFATEKTILYWDEVDYNEDDEIIKVNTW